MSRITLDGEKHHVDIHVGRRLRDLRRTMGLSQSELGERLGISFQQVQKYEKGENRISASKLFEAAHFLHTSIATFFFGLPGQTAKEGDDALAALTGDEDFVKLTQAYLECKDRALRRKLVAAFELCAR